MKSYKLPIPTLPVLVIPDTHVPFHDKRSWEALLKFATEREWGGILLGGDFLDLDQLSRFSEGDARLLSARGLRKDFDLGNRLLDRIDKIPCNGWKAYLKGNHEARVDNFTKRHPQLEEILSIPYNMGLDERGWHWVDCYDSEFMTLQVGHAHFIHGHYINEHNAKKHVQRYGVNIFYFHTHTFQVFSMPRGGKDDTLVGATLGHMALPNQAYKKGRPDAWQQGFAMFDFHKNGYFNWSFTGIQNHRFKIGGEVYSG